MENLPSPMVNSKKPSLASPFESPFRQQKPAGNNNTKTAVLSNGGLRIVL
jgi:hypothetical protein